MFPQWLRIFKQNFTCHVRIYAILHNFIRLSLTLTRLCQINFVKVRDSWIKVCSVATTNMQYNNRYKHTISAQNFVQKLSVVYEILSEKLNEAKTFWLTLYREYSVVANELLLQRQPVLGMRVGIHNGRAEPVIKSTYRMIIVRGVLLSARKERSLFTFRIRRIAKRNVLWPRTSVCSVYVCLSVPRRISTLLHGPGCKFKNGRGWRAT